MSMSMKAVFRVEDGVVHFERMTLLTDGAESMITGDADIANWPEMTYQVKSTVDFKRMRELFFAKDNYTLSGEGRFNGVFHLFKGGRALTGDFESDVAGLQIGGHDYEFPDLKGKLGWFPNRFEVMDTTTGFYGGEASLKYSILSSGKPGQPSNARFDAEWRDVDLADYSDFLGMEGVRLAGRWSGRNLLAWPLGRFRERAGDGYSKVIPPAGAEVLAGTQASELASGPDRGGVHPAIGHLPIAGEVTYRYDQRLARVFGRPILDAGDRRHVQRPHGVGRQLAHPLPCDERRSAGKRSRAGGDDDGVRRAHQRRSPSAARPSSPAS